jgi:D-glycero-alpha-D-manno-heptose-7-phosphate kinase
MAVEACDEQVTDLTAKSARGHRADCTVRYNFPLVNRIVSSAPTRIDLAGGTIDIWPLYLFHDGAMTLNAAISVRAHVEVASRQDGAVVLRSLDTDRVVRAKNWSDLARAGDLSLLALLARHYRLENATLTTRGESPAGAGIAGSSALTIAACGALARWTHSPTDAEHLLQVAMNVECQTIRVPTGVQDYRPALYGGIAAIELGVTGVSRTAIDVDPRELEQRVVLAYTGAPRHSGTNNWEITKRHTDGDPHVFDCFERIRDTAVAMRTALERGDWDEVGRQIAIEWDNRKRLAPGVTTPTIDDLVARAKAAGATAAKVCGAGGGGCLFTYGPPGARAAIADALEAGGARVLPYRIETEGLRLG